MIVFITKCLIRFAIVPTQMFLTKVNSAVFEYSVCRLPAMLLFFRGCSPLALHTKSEALCSWGVIQLSAGTKGKFITKSRSLKLLPGRIPSARHKAEIYTADDCTSVRPPLQKTFCCAFTLFEVHKYFGQL